MIIFKIVLYSTIVFLILYFEPLYIDTWLGVFKFSQLWKTVFITFLVVNIYLKLTIEHQSKISEVKIPKSLFVGYLFALWPLMGSLYGGFFVDDASLTFKRLLPILIIHYCIINNFTIFEYKKFLIWLIFFIVLSTLPFNLNLLEPLGTPYDVIRLLGGEKPGFIGIFQNAHAASLVLSFCLLISTIYAFEVAKPFYNSIGAILSAYISLMLLSTYVRVGIASFLIGISIFILISGKLKTLVKTLVLGITVLTITFITFADISHLVSRFSGRTIFSGESRLSFDDRLSGRVLFAISSLETYRDSSPIEWVIGMGQTNQLYQMESRIGRALFPHNGFINELLISGLVGFVLMIMFLKSVYSDIKSIQDLGVRSLGLAVFAAWLTYQFFQGGEFPFLYLFIIPFILYNYADKSHIYSSKKVVFDH